MRPFEIATVFLLLVAWGSYLVPGHRRPRWLFVFPVLAVVVALVQLGVEGYRWQMVPADALAALLFIAGMASFVRKTEPITTPTGQRHQSLRIATMALGLILLIIAFALPAAFPIFQLPTPTGSYAVGTTTLELVDQSRPEIYPPGTTVQRDLMVQVWYPADKVNVNGAKPQPYQNGAYGPFLAASMHLPGFVFDYVHLIPTHSYQDVPVAEALPRYPVLIFSHGFDDIVTENTVQMEELSSHGYVVFSIAHPYNAAVVIYPDGRTVPTSPAQPTVFPIDSGGEIEATHAKCLASADPVSAQACWRHYIALFPIVESMVPTWTQDTRFVMDELERINRGDRPSLFAGRLDLDRIGLFGHSMGGSTAGEVCSLDARCKAGVNLDGLQMGGLLDHPTELKQPFMIMYSNDLVGIDDFLYSQVENQVYRVFIKGTKHFSYSDYSIDWPGSPVGAILGKVGPIDGQRMETILNSYLVAFFDKHLMGIASPLLDGPDPNYPEVDFQKR